MKTSSLSRRLLMASAAALALSSAQAWTDKPIKLLVPAPAGGTMDVVARVIAQQLSADIGQPVVVDNKPGAGGAIAVQAMLQAPADGLTIMVTADNVLTEIPHVLKLPYDPLKDVKPIATVARAGMVLVANPTVPADNVKALAAYVKANPGKTSFASYSAGTTSHYAGMILNQKEGLDMQHVPFAGSPPALQQVMGGQIQVMFDGMATSLPQIKGVKLKALGVAGRTRSTHLPDVPTLTELGYPELVFGNWLGVIGSSALPADITNKINAAVVKAAAADAIKGRLTAAGFEPNTPATPTELATGLKADFERNAAIVKRFDIKLNQ
ncbi:MAG: Bug family tripartite tricarboxylate transporter substrate binding protein [Brachymonas sp.]